MSDIRQTIFATVLTMAFLWSIPVPVAADGPSDTQIRMEIKRVDAEIEKYAVERQRYRKGMDKSVIFTREANKWFDRLKQVNAEIKEVESSPGTTFDGRNKTEALRLLNAKKQNILSLKGAGPIIGHKFASLAELKATYDKLTKQALDIPKEYYRIADEQARFDRKRDRLVAQLKDKTTVAIEGYKKKLKNRQDLYQRLSLIANNKDIWPAPGFADNDVDILYLDRRTVINAITMVYYEETIKSGKKFNSRELAGLIKEGQRRTLNIKNKIRTKHLPKIANEIADLKHLIALDDIPVYKILGCWQIRLRDSTDLPTITISSPRKGVYEARVKHPGSLKYYKKKQLLFSVMRMPKGHNVFSGTEFSYTSYGKRVDIPLRIQVLRGGTVMTYRTDETLELWRCSTQ